MTVPMQAREIDRQANPGPLRALWHRVAAAFGNGDDLVDDRRGWERERRRR